MNINGSLGETGFKALFKYNGTWEVSTSYFFSYEEAKEYFTHNDPREFKWPVDIQEDQRVYIPSKEELE